MVETEVFLRKSLDERLSVDFSLFRKMNNQHRKATN